MKLTTNQAFRLAYIIVFVLLLVIIISRNRNSAPIADQNVQKISCCKRAIRRAVISAPRKGRPIGAYANTGTHETLLFIWQ